jgi:hypothetical protein
MRSDGFLKPLRRSTVKQNVHDDRGGQGMDGNQVPGPASGPTPEGGTSRGIFSILLGVFTAPTRAFGDFNQQPKWSVILVALAVAIVLGTIFAIYTAPISAQTQLEMMRKSTTLPPELLQQIEQQAQTPNSARAGIAAAVMVPIVTVIVALIAWGIGSLLFGGMTTFRKIWGVTVLGGLITTIGNLLKLPLIVAKKSMFVSFGLAALFPGKDFTSLVYTILYYADIFLIWSVIVVGFGYAAIFGFPRGKGMTTSILSNAIMIMVMITLAVVGMSFAGIEISFF